MTAKSAPPAAGTFQPTAALVQDAELAKRVDALAASDRVESSHVGASGAQGPSYTRFLAVLEKVTSNDLRALLRHESPIVRAYVSESWVKEHPNELSAVVPLLDDNTEFKTLSGCMGGVQTVAQRVFSAICKSEAPAASQLLRDFIAQDTWAAPFAVECLARHGDGTVAQTIAAVIKDTSRSSALREAAVRAFMLAPVASLCETLRTTAATDADPLRQVALGALSRCDDATSQAILEVAAKSLVASLANEAKIALLLATRTPGARRTELGRDERHRAVAASRLEERVRVGPIDEGLVIVIEALVNEHPDDFGQPLWSLPTSPEATAMMRRLAAKFGVGRAVVRTPVIRYFGRLEDRADAAEVARSLDSTDLNEATAAVEALVAILGKDARPKLQALASKSAVDPSLKDAATAALAKL
ncbi:MAG: hypothetical protein U0271_36230 [Polyangiaceae bacterium]